MNLSTHPKSRHLNLNEEPTKVREAYGMNRFGQGCLMARRLVESGVKFVEITLDGWDTHQNNFERVKELLNIVDPAFAMLSKTSVNVTYLTKPSFYGLENSDGHRKLTKMMGETITRTVGQLL